MDNSEIVVEANEPVKAKKSKEELRRDRELDRSVVNFSKKNISSLGIVGVHPEHNVLYLSSETYVKIYSLKGVALSLTRRDVLINALCGFTPHRLRLSSFLYPSSDASVVFLSVFFKGKRFSEVADEIQEFDRNLSLLMTGRFKLSFTPISIGDAFMFIFMNYRGQMKNISTRAVLKKNVNFKRDFLLEIVEDNDSFKVLEDNKYGFVNMCLQYPEKFEENFFERLKKIGVGYLSCIDFQRIETDMDQSYKKMIEASYNSDIENNEEKNVNATFILSMLFEEKGQLDLGYSLAKDIFADSGLVMVPCNGIQTEVFPSLATFGLVDFHCMRRVTIDILANLIG